MSTDAAIVGVRPTRYRKLRIAWTVAWGVVAVLFVVLWVRSDSWRDSLEVRISQSQVAGVGSDTGDCKLFLRERANEPKLLSYSSYPVGGLPSLATSEVFSIPPVLSVLQWGGSQEIVAFIPLWFLATVSTLFAPLPWLRYRFSLRTLLIATTLVAMALGAIIWARG